MNTTAEPEYVKLRIMLNTNNGKQVELKSDMFAFDSKVSGDGPYVCTNINYSKSTLILLPHQEQVEIFMNESKFKDFCITSRSKKGAETSKDEDVRSTIINNNIGIMLNALFPVSFPIQDTVESLCPNTSIPSDSLYVKLTKPTVYTYMNIDGTATVTKVVWLNVMYQNPAYKQLYEIVKKYYKRMYAYIYETLIDPWKEPDTEEKKEEKIKEEEKKEENPKMIDITQTLNMNTWDDNDYIKHMNTIISHIKLLQLEQRRSDNNSIYNYENQINMWKLYYMFKGMKKNSQEYNDFMEKYVDLFINVKDKELQKMEDELEVKEDELEEMEAELKTMENELKNKEAELEKTDEADKVNVNATINKLEKNIKKLEDKITKLENIKKGIEDRISSRKNKNTNISDEQRQASNEKRFNDSVQKELDFHFKYIEQLTEYMPLKRASLNPKVKLLFKDNVLNVQDFVKAMADKNNKYCTTVDKIDDGKMYEIQVGMALVGGKVTPDVASKLRCKFDNYKLAKQWKDYNAGVLFTYPYIDLKPDIERLQKALVNKAEAKPTVSTAKPTVQPPIKAEAKPEVKPVSGGSKRTRKRNKNKKRRFTRYNK